MPAGRITAAAPPPNASRDGIRRVIADRRFAAADGCAVIEIGLYFVLFVEFIGIGENFRVDRFHQFGDAHLVAEELFQTIGNGIENGSENIRQKDPSREKRLPDRRIRPFKGLTEILDEGNAVGF